MIKYPKDVSISVQQYSMKTISNMLSEGKMFFDKEVLSNKARSKIIENFFLKVPIMSGVFCQLSKGVQVVVGKNIIESIYYFVTENSFSLEGLEYFPELNGKCFSELPLRWKRYILEYIWTVYRINCISDEVSEDICKRYVSMIKQGGKVV